MAYRNYLRSQVTVHDRVVDVPDVADEDTVVRRTTDSYWNGLTVHRVDTIIDRGDKIAVLVHDLYTGRYMIPMIYQPGSKRMAGMLIVRDVEFRREYGRDRILRTAEDTIYDVLIQQERDQHCRYHLSTTELGVYRPSEDMSTGSIDVYVVDVDLVNEHGNHMTIDPSLMQSSLLGVMLRDQVMKPSEVSVLNKPYVDGYTLPDILHDSSMSVLTRCVAIDEQRRQDRLHINQLDDVMMTLEVLDTRHALADVIMWRYEPEIVKTAINRSCTNHEANLVRREIIRQIPAFIHDALTSGGTPRTSDDLTTITAERAAFVVAGGVVDAMLMDVHEWRDDYIVAYANWFESLTDLIHVVKKGSAITTDYPSELLEDDVSDLRDREHVLSDMGLIHD